MGKVESKQHLLTEYVLHHCKNGSVTLPQVGLSELQLHYQNNVQTSRSKKLHHCKSQASVNNGRYNQGSYYRNAKSAAALVRPLTV